MQVHVKEALQSEMPVSYVIAGVLRHNGYLLGRPWVMLSFCLVTRLSDTAKSMRIVRGGTYGTNG
jgi:hypothetical protein